MRTLAIDCATQACSAALLEGDALVAGDYREIGRGHAEQLLPMVAGLPDKGRADRILVSLGPGSFTGVRIGLAAARALGLAWKADVLGYPTLSLVAAMARGGDCPGGEVTVCMAGGHGEWFVQDFDLAGEPLNDVASLSPQDVAARRNQPCIAGNKAADLATLLRSERHTATTLLPDARQAMRLPPSCLTTDLSPIYGRAPDAKLPGQA
ncbi:tRNA (adenosine(37)-N6)-threonylcarbamoyltransferase complex dimerization subunit type 1 TsaB [Paraurantiacibacter namhicola]|uniref:tRNA threonylcarbamoyladenosine biosynthesis protein TsaB n=1 Tax=Paraurantiacibacter namhicola TaxID=645517 RepID=A0A1C7D7W4_9SPHN|nr:tRNA (adenosine(37)-N6)-threonylcarbamoyltransferase complex dimerization subunit type 1 TsaB [Paraurantiacibacter namhicola]ANU07569.1 tRNA threonylcarbamoyladenosine biosynthesis protein TsaB [Paraurantiacibacter namhicola]